MLYRRGRPVGAVVLLGRRGGMLSHAEMSETRTPFMGLKACNESCKYNNFNLDRISGNHNTWRRQYAIE